MAPTPRTSRVSLVAYLFASIVLATAHLALITPWAPGLSGDAQPALSSLLTAVGYVFLGLGIARFARGRGGGGERGSALDGAVVTIALSAVLIEAILARHGGPGADPWTLSAMMVVALSASWIVAMTTRLLLAGGHRSASGRWIVAASVAGMVGAIGFVVAGAEHGLATSRASIGWLLALPLMGAAVLHPSRGESADRRTGVEAVHVWARTLLLGIALAAVPVAIVVRHVATGATAVVAVGAAVAIAAIVSVRVGQLASDRERAHQQAAHLALHDPLTGLANRILLDDRLRHALARRRDAGSTVGVLSIDLDGFRTVNDTLGHSAGDELLCAMAERLLAVVRPFDTVARFVGDKFVIVVQEVDEAAVGALADRVASAVRRPVVLRPGVGVITASVGLVLAAPDEREPDHVLRRADAALCEVRQRDGDRYVRTIPC